MQLSGAAAVVTGGASGIGLGIARALARRGVRVLLADIEGEKAEAEAAAIRSAGGEASAAPLDVVEEDSWAALAELTQARLGDVTLLFNNAGVGGGSTAHETPRRVWEWVLSVNLTGVYLGVRAFAPLMLEHGRPARIVNTGSEHSLGLPPTARGGVAAPYTASKHAVMGYTLCMRRDWEGTSLSAAILCPGLVASEIWNSFRNRQPAFGGPRQGRPEWGETNARGLSADVAGERVAEQMEADAFFMFTCGGDEQEVFETFSAEAGEALAAFRGRYG